VGNEDGAVCACDTYVCRGVNTPRAKTPAAAFTVGLCLQGLFRKHPISGQTRLRSAATAVPPVAQEASASAEAERRTGASTGGRAIARASAPDHVEQESLRRQLVRAAQQ
jgi:hypothetical protein